MFKTNKGTNLIALTDNFDGFVTLKSDLYNPTTQFIPISKFLNEIRFCWRFDSIKILSCSSCFTNYGLVCHQPSRVDDSVCVRSSIVQLYCWFISSETSLFNLFLELWFSYIRILSFFLARSSWYHYSSCQTCS